MKSTNESAVRTTGTILVVDDEAANIALLRGFLEPEGYRVLSASGGQEALDKAFRESPDLILLDVIMPLVGGFDVCRLLKNDERTRFVPVVFITALHDRQSKLQGLEAGGDDFLAKPLDDVELLAKCRNLLRIKRLSDELRASNASLKEMEKLQSDLTHMIVHDIRNAMTAVMGSITLAWQSEGIPKSLRELFRTGLENCQRLLSMADDLLDTYRLESAELPIRPQPVELGRLLREQAAVFGAQLLNKQLACEVQAAEQPLFAEADPALLWRVVGNLLGNAVSYSPPQGKIRLVARADLGAATALVSVFNEGAPIAAEHQTLIFEKFKRFRPEKLGAGAGFGLGLAFCKMAVQAHGGQIWVRSPDPEGMSVGFHFTLPLGAEPKGRSAPADN